MTLEIPIIIGIQCFCLCADDVTVILKRKEKPTKYSPNNMIMTFSLEYSRISHSQARILSKLVFLVTSYSSNRAVCEKKTGKIVFFFFELIKFRLFSIYYVFELKIKQMRHKSTTFPVMDWLAKQKRHGNCFNLKCKSISSSFCLCSIFDLAANDTDLRDRQPPKSTV